MRLIKSFIQGIMNKDLDERLIPDGQYRDALNIEVSASEGAGVGALENIKGNTNVSNQTFTANAKTIGAVADEANNNIYWFVNDPDGAGAGFDYVLKYNEINGITTVLLKDTIGNANSVLKFNPSYLITGVNIIDGLLFWTDNINPPRRLNVAKYYPTDGFIEDDISVIVKPALNSPLITLQNSTTTNQENNLEDKFLEFACRYKYENDEYSAISPFSSTAFGPSSYSYDFGDGEFESMINTYNQVEVSYFINGSNPGSGWVPDPRIKEIQLLFRDTASTNINVIQSFTIEEITTNPSLGIDADGRFNNIFDNSKIYTVLPPDEITRLFDNVPLKAKAQELIGSRIAYGNYVQFYDIIDSSGKPIEIDYSLEIQSTAVSGTPLPTFRSDRDYEIGLVYLDEYSRMTTVLTSDSNTIHIPPTDSPTANDIRVSINNEAPSFAKKYRIFIKQPKGKYYNIFPIYYFVDEVFRWFRINQSDVDKVKINDYIIAKTYDGVATKVDKQYKVIDIQSQPEDFLDNSESQPAGLYFKIKVDDSSIFDGTDVFDRSYNTAHWSKFNNVSALSGIGARDWINTSDGERIPIVNTPVYYGNSNTNNQLDIIGFTAGSNTFGPNETYTQWIRDFRIKITIDGNNTFHWDIFSDSGYVRCQGTENTVIDSVNGNSINNTNVSGPTLCKIKFTVPSGYKIGDYWIINIHCKNWQNIFGNFINWDTTNNPQQAALLPSNNSWRKNDDGSDVVSRPQPQSTGYTTIDRTISAGARIRIRIKDVSGVQRTSGVTSPSGAGVNWQEWQEWVSPLQYVNIEEWFWQSGAYRDFVHLNTNGDDIGVSNVFFRRGFSILQDNSFNGGSYNFLQQTISSQNPPLNGNWSAYTAQFGTVYMGIRGTGAAHDPGTGIQKRGYIECEMEIIQQTNNNVFETIPEENPADIYHELSDTFDIINGAHQGNLGASSNQNLTTNTPAKISINTTTKLAATQSDIENSMYNAYCFGNGVEGLRIRGDFNASALAYSPRVSSVIEDYKQQRVEEAITYSGIYRENTGINNLNEFNLSLANFKYIDKFFGSIQKLHARDTDLVAFQENKVSKILYGKNLLSDSVGGGVVASIPEVLGTQVTFTGEYGISENPESFATWGNDMYFTDSRRGAVMRLGSNGMFEISSQGMRDYFKDLFISNSRTQKIGAIDPFKERYVLANNDTLNPPCDFSVKPPSGGLKIGNAANTDVWTVVSNTEWTVAWVGATWLTVNTQATPYSGEDSEFLNFTYAANATGSNRSVTVTFTACGVSYPFTITQYATLPIERKVIVIGNSVDGGLIANQKYDFTSNTTGGDIDFDGVALTKNAFALDNGFNSFEGVDSIPVAGDTVTLKAGVTGTDTIKPFNPNFGNSLRYLVTDVEYSEADVKTLILLSTATTPAIVGSNYEGSFTFSRPSNEKFLYLIYDYRNNITPPATLTSSASIAGTVNSIADYTNRRGNVNVRCTPSGTNTFYVKWNDRIVGQAIDIVGVTDITFFKNELLPGNIEIIASGGGAFTAQAAASTLQSFLIDLTDDDITTVCPRVPASTRYHSGSAALPVVGDVIYDELSGLTAYDGNNSLHKVGAADDYVIVNKEGLVIGVGDCAACSEVAVPVINQPAITLTVGENITLEIPTSNNPISFAVSTTCNTYQINGGTDGAQFTYTDCTTSNTESITIESYSSSRVCTTTVPVVVSGTGTSSLIGTCDEQVLPPGITIDKNSGILNGTAIIAGIYSFRITATNCFGTSALSTISITINPNTTNRRFNMDSSNPETTSGLACAVTPSYSIFYHDGQKEYPEVNDFIYNFCECEQRIFNGGYLWYVTDELTGGKNNVIRIDSVGQVVEKVVCP